MQRPERTYPELWGTLAVFPRAPGILCLALAFLLGISAWANPEPLRGPSNEYLSQVLKDPDAFNRARLPATPDFFQSAIALYQGHLSNRRCLFVPSCSRYSYLCFESQGTSRALVATFKRLYRCNASAAGRYPWCGSYLLDLPTSLQLGIPHGSLEPSGPFGEEAGPDYGEWLLRHGEWAGAYDYFLRRQFEHDSAENRLALALTALNMGRPDWVGRWVTPDLSTEARLLCAIAAYRIGDYAESSSLSVPLFNGGEAVQRQQAAVLYLVSRLQLLESAQDSLHSFAFGQLYPQREREECEQWFRVATRSPRRWPSMTASLIPGLGQMVNGFIRDGLVAMTICGVLGVAAGTSYAQDNIAGGIFFTGFFGYAYLANLEAGAEAPRRRTVEQAILLRDRLYVRFNPINTVRPTWLGRAAEPASP